MLKLNTQIVFLCLYRTHVKTYFDSSWLKTFMQTCSSGFSWFANFLLCPLRVLLSINERCRFTEELVINQVLIETGIYFYLFLQQISLIAYFDHLLWGFEKRIS